MTARWGCSSLGAVLAVAGGLASAGCTRPGEPVHEGNWRTVLRPVPESPPPAPPRRLVYVPIYSSIYWGFDRQLAELAATLSIRNVSPAKPLAVHSVKYYDSGGKLVREYLDRPGLLGPMATADFVIPRHDTSGGPGANFVVAWSNKEDADDPVIEAVMVGQYGSAGISFLSSARPLPKASAELAPTR